VRPADVRPEPLAQVAPVATAVPTPVPEPTAVPTPEPTPMPLHPLSIAAMRAREYPGSDLVIEQTLAPGVNYNQYVVSYRSEGLKIYALLTVPRGQRPPSGWPAIIFNHGYIPPREYRTTERYVAYVDAFARNGYIVLKPDYRGHGSSEGEARGGYSSPDYVVDVLNAVASVRRWPDADPNRIGMWGHSMGGYITLRALVIDPSIKAGVIWAGVVATYPDLIARWGRPPTAPAGPAVPPGAAPAATRTPSWREQLIMQYGTPEENPGFWASISANTYLKDLPGPVQLHHGTADASVPLWMSQRLEEQIREAGGSVELFVYPGDDHNISRNLGTALARSVAFFNAHVKGS
jgi:dipeptidyl aminopeptidase/acylaminoacyl peptidase